MHDYVYYEESFHAVCKAKDYSMNGILQHLGTHDDVNVQLQAGHGNTPMTLINNIIHKSGLQDVLAALHTGTGATVNKFLPKLPAISNVGEKMQPDITVFYKCCVEGNVVFKNVVLFAEEQSGHDFNKACLKSSLYTCSVTRSWAHSDKNRSGRCIVFPSATYPNEKSCVALITCHWDYSKFCFVYKAERIRLCNLVQRITELLLEHYTEQMESFVQIKHLYKLDLEILNTTEYFSGYQFLAQFCSAESIVLKVKVVSTGEICVMKCVGDKTASKLVDWKDSLSDLDCLLHFTRRRNVYQSC